MLLSNSNETLVPFDQEGEAFEGLEWFAVQVKCRYEERIVSILTDKGFEALSATSKVAIRARRSCYAESRALFPGYIFARFEALKRMPVLVTPGVQAIVGYGKIPVPVQESEIAAIRQVLESGQTVEQCPFLLLGDEVEVIAGPLKGMRGILVQQKSSCRVVLSVSLIQRSIRVEVPESALAPLSKDSFARLMARTQPNLTTTICAR